MQFFKKKIITRSGPHGTEPYLIRYSIFTCSLFAIKLHRILQSDDACLHDHPWAFISFILCGGYVEESPHHSTIGSNKHSWKRLYGPGCILYRPARWAHRLEIFQPATTLVITFKKTRQWGFFTPKGWIEWFKYQPTEKCE
jgi:hypothetical protein